MSSTDLRILRRRDNMRKSMLRYISLVLVFMIFICLGGCSGRKEPPDAPSDMEFKGKRIYFAGPLFSAAEKEYNLKIVKILESYGYEVFLPQRDGYLAPDLEGLTAEEISKKIFDKDLEEVMKSDIVFILLDGRVPDEGACVELGVAYAAGKRCYGFKSDSRSIEIGMDLNPMISGCFIKLFYGLDEEELIRSLREYLKEYKL